MAKARVHREPITSDVVFKAVFGSDTAESKAALIELLNIILERDDNPIVDLVYLNPFSIVEDASEKVIIMDIKVKVQSGEHIDVEMQTGEYDIFINRTVYYACKQLSKSLGSGERYDSLKKSVVISFVADTIFPDHTDMHSVYSLRNDTHGEQLSDLVELHYIELGKLGQMGINVGELTPLEQVCAYFKCTREKEHAELLEELIRNGGKVISMADQILRKVSEDERLQHVRESRELAKMEISWALQSAENRGIQQGIQQGRAEGIQQGRTEGIQQGRIEGIQQGRTEGIQQGRTEEREKAHAEKIEFAKKMKQRGLTHADIAEYTGLNLKEIESL